MVFSKYKYGLIALIALFFSFKAVFAQDVLTPDEARRYLLENYFDSNSVNEERLYVKQCFKDDNPYHYCLVRFNWQWYYFDKNLQQPYDVYMFDNGPDYSSEGYYRIRKNGKIGFADETTGEIAVYPIYECAHPFRNGRAEVGLKCQTIRDGEYSYWEAEEWFLLDRPER
ncbi:WG repeat-containing protein [Ignatzschineria sp. LJL83]